MKPKMRRAILLIVIFSFSCISAGAADWKTFFMDSQNHKYYIDAASIVRLPENKVRAWQYTDGDDRFWLVEIDCTQRMRKVRDIMPVSGSNREQEFRELDHEGLLKSLDEKSWEYIGTSDLEKAQYETWCTARGVRSNDPTKSIELWVQLSDGEFKKKSKAEEDIRTINATYAQIRKSHSGSKLDDKNIPKIIKELDEETSIQLSIKKTSEFFNYMANLPQVSTLADILNPKSPNPGWDAPIPGIISVENIEWDNIKKAPIVIRYTKDFSQSEVDKVFEKMVGTKRLSFLKYPSGLYTLDIDLVEKRIRSFKNTNN